MNKRPAMAIGVSIVLSACVSVPPEAPELSSRLGHQIGRLEASHNQLIAQYFAQKRRAVDDFIEKFWVPHFAQAFFNGTDIQSVWDDVVQSGSAEDRLRLLTIAGPALLSRVNKKRRELLDPLDTLERSLSRRVRSAYDQTRATNTAITAYLRSASQVSETRAQYLAMAGISESDFDRVISATDSAVRKLTSVTGQARDRVADVRNFRDRMRSLAETLNALEEVKE